MRTNKILFLSVLLLLAGNILAQQYDNFRVAIYCRAYEVEKMKDPQWLQSAWDDISKQLKVDKIYLETHRDLLIVDGGTIESAKKFFQDKGLKVGGGITYTIDEMNNFETFCSTNPEQRQKVKEIAEHTARYFDEFILDDFFFTSCKCDLCIAAKGDKSWTDFRLELMKNAATDLVIGPAKAVNPNVEVVIKYPNWHEHFQGLGFNLQDEPPLFDGIYTGTETRDRSSDQHLQQYLGYSIFRYFEHLKPGNNRGGWVDTGGSNPLDRYAEQLWLTAFAKAPEITLFDIRQMLMPVRKETRSAWQGSGNSFDFDAMMDSYPDDNGEVKYSRAAGYSLELVDKVLGELGNPVGVKSYKPFHSHGEDFLQNYFGMIGIPMDIVPDFPENEPIVVLTETASFDPQIVSKIEDQLKNGNNVLVTSGFYKAMQGRGIENIAELNVSDRKASVKEFSAGWGPATTIEKEIIIPQITYYTNDSWEQVSAKDDTNGWPVLHAADYSKGKFYVLTIPDNFIDLYALPENALNLVRQITNAGMKVNLEGPGEVSLFMYDNNSFVVESFLDHEVSVNIVTDLKTKQLKEIPSNEVLKGADRIAPSFRNRKSIEMVVTKTPVEHTDAAFVCDDVEINCTGPKPARGYFAKPVNAPKGTLPIVLNVHAAGVKGSWCLSRPETALRYAAMGKGALSFDLNAHGMLNGQPQEYYNQLEAGELNRYWEMGAETREENYFRGMYLRLLRTLDFLCRQPEWDGKRILVTDESQGGGQALAAARLDHRVSAAVATVPAMCDFGRKLIGETGGWPNPFAFQDDEQKMLETYIYFDTAHILKGSKAALVTEIGLIDYTCPALGIYSAIN